MGAPTFDEIFAVMTEAATGDVTVRVPLPDEPDTTDLPTRFALALNVLLEDLAFRVAERERAEERLRQSQKMEAIGKLAGGVAHDFNNMLSVILGYTELALNGLDPDEPMHADLREIKHAGERARDLTRQLLAFSRKQVLSPRVLQLDAVLRNLEQMLRRLLGEGIELALVVHRKSGKIHADPSQIEQVVMNLVVNARDAMPSGGKLIIETSDVELDGNYAAQHPDVVPGSYVMLAVTDTGIGMTKDTQAHIFEPFFTTKEHGKGTGLGLATVFGIVRQSGGHIWLYSEPGRGSTFKVYFPRTLLPEEGGTAKLTPARNLDGVETILIVEDDAQVRALASTVLRRSGYNVLEAESAGDAILIVEEYPARIHLLLTDVVMPRMNGKQLAERLLRLRTDLLVLYMSGYTDNAIVHHGVLDAGAAYLQKPLTPDSLLRRVRDLLDRS
jgi:signal transduction histidine kinase